MLSGWRGSWSKLEFGEKYSFVVYERWGKKFQVVVDTEEAIKFKKGEETDWDSVIVHPYVFVDLNKGILASTEDLKKMLFEVAVDKLSKKLGRPLDNKEKEKIKDELDDWDDEKIHYEAAKIVVEKGFLKLPEKVRDRLIEEKMTEMLRYLQKYAVNPATNAPYPPTKLEEAFRKVIARGIKIDPLLDVKGLLPIVVKALQDVLPLKLEIIIARVKIPAEYTGPLYGKIANLGTIKEQKWLDDGSLEAIVEIPAGVFLQFNNLIVNNTRGQGKVEVISRKRL